MSFSEELRTVFKWDTGDVDKGAQRVERALDRVQKAENRTGGGNRSGLGGLGARLGIAAVVAAGAHRGVSLLREELEKTDRAADRLQASFQALNRTNTFTTRASGTAALSAQIGASDEQVRGEKEQQADVSTAIGIRDAARNGNPLSRLAEKAYDRYREFLGKTTLEANKLSSELRAKIVDKDANRMAGERSAAYSDELAIERMRAPGSGNNPYDAKRKELAVSEELAVQEAEKAKASAKDLGNIRARYIVLRNTVYAEEAIAKARFQNASARLSVDGSARSPLAKQLKNAADAKAQSQALIASGNLTQEEERAERLNIQRAENDNKAALESRYLNPDGSRRKQSAIMRDFRKDRSSERKRARFFKQVEKGGFDPETGRRRVTGDTPGGGLRSGGLEDGPAGGGLRTGGLGSSDWGAAFPRKATTKEKPAAQTPESAHLGKIHDVLDKRLPKATL